MKKIDPQKLLIQLVIVTIGMMIGISAFSNWNKEEISQNQDQIGSNTADIPPLSKTEGFGEGSGGEVKPIVAPSPNSLTLITGATKTNLFFTEDQTLYEILNSKENAGKINFKGKDYTGIGFFVTDIGELHSGDGKDLLYYVNGIEASSGISVYKPKVGDVVEWKLE